MSKDQKQVVVTISGLSKKLADALRQRAKKNNRSLSGEIRAIVESCVAAQQKESA
jgi:plasmid stability protein